MIANSKFFAAANFHSRPVAVIPGFAGVGDDLAFPFQLAVTQQRLFQDGAFVFQLGRVSSVLIVASAATAKVRARRLHAIRRWLEHLINRSTGKAALFLHNGRAHLFRRQHKRQEDRLPFRKAGETIAAIDKLFDRQVHR
jgi:hypothetical protein